MSPSRLLRSLKSVNLLYSVNGLSWKPRINHRQCSCSSLSSTPLALSATTPLSAPWDPDAGLLRDPSEGHQEAHLIEQRRKGRKKNKEKAQKETEVWEKPPTDHRAIGTAQSLFTTHPSSPGAPFFLPNGTHIFQKLISFLRAQYPQFGFREVLTPTMYKEGLWKQSGHWDNYKDDMFMVTGNSSVKSHVQPLHHENDRMLPKESAGHAAESEDYGLKPMNCPGHCLLYNSERRSYRDLPIRYAEFSPLHRNEISGALSGLTRVRRFHQDDGHIFCRPSQIKQEISQSLTFIRMVYDTLGLSSYRFVLSTRPANGYIGTLEEWDRAENDLKAALDEYGNLGLEWTTEEGEGAFYGPKIDIILTDNHGKEHQTGTIQLDFQLPKRFELTYESPATELEAQGQDWESSETRATLGKVTPVMIHRAVLGSLERFMALLLENREGNLPFWLNHRQVIILTVSKKKHITAYARQIKTYLITGAISGESPRLETPSSMIPPPCTVEIDESADSIAQKVVRAKKNGYSLICVVGERNTAGSQMGIRGTVDLDVTALQDQRKTWDLIESVKPGSQAPVQKDKGRGAHLRGNPGIRLDVSELSRFIKALNTNYG